MFALVWLNLLNETLIYVKWYITVSAPDMPTAFKTDAHISHVETPSETFPALLELPLPLLDYRIIIAIAKRNVGAASILKDVMDLSKDLRIPRFLLALGPTAPISLRPPVGTRILWATFTDGGNLLTAPRLTIVPPTQLTDLSLTLEKLSKTRYGRIPLIVGDFLDNVLSVSSDQAGLYAFLCKLFTRIRTNNETAFFLATEDMHDQRKIAILRRFADVVIEYEAMREQDSDKFQVKILDLAQNHFATWDSNGPRDSENNPSQGIRVPTIGRQLPRIIQEPARNRI